jgi:hypothetical protein
MYEILVGTIKLLQIPDQTAHRAVVVSLTITLTFLHTKSVCLSQLS